jgi:hypothetical protein
MEIPCSVGYMYRYTCRRRDVRERTSGSELHELSVAGLRVRERDRVLDIAVADAVDETSTSGVYCDCNRNGE